MNEQPGIIARTAARVMRAFPTWSYPGPVTSTGITTQDSGWLPWSFPLNYWQTGHRGHRHAECSAVEACVSAYAQTLAMLPGAHWKTLDNGGRIEVKTSPLANVLLKPNAYQTRSDFLMNQVRALYFRGNAYALAERDANDTIVALHPVMPQNCAPRVDPDTNEVFYSIAPTDLTPDSATWEFDAARMLPARSVWHLRLHTPTHPLIGETPLQAAMLAIFANCSIQEQQQRFFENMSRPSGTLNTDLILSASQVAELRQRWQEQSSGLNVGGVPILTAGLKWTALSLSAADAQLIEFYKLSVADIARAMRVPLPLIGVMENTTFNNAETLLNFWLASGLGFLLEHVESSLDRFFGLPRGDYCELDTQALLRSNFKERMEGIAQAVQAGVYSPNEARAQEGLARAEYGDEPRLQQQVVPLSFYADDLALKEKQAEAPKPDPAPQVPPQLPPPIPEDTEKAIRAAIAAAMKREDISHV